MTHEIYTCLWFDTQAEEAARFYTSIFENSIINYKNYYTKEGFDIHHKEAGSVLTVNFQIGDLKFVALNGGPEFKFSQANSFFVNLDTESEIDRIWERLSEGNSKVFMPLDYYHWSKKYGWIRDKYGLSWQLNLTGTPQKITPFLMFDGAELGKGREAIDFYTTVFPDSQLDNMVFYGQENPDYEGLIVHSVFNLSGQEFMVMDSGLPNNIIFNEAVSYMVYCQSQKEIDYFWDKLTEGGLEGQCGWLKDKFGVSWQVAPSILPELLNDPERAGRVIQAFMPMKKFDINTIINA
ncbi:MAG: VOC family protein [Bacteroidales bacterium]|nr:VOC family protein [Bacteroidales bacterium]